MPVNVLNQESIQYDSIVTLETVICYKCAVPFAIPERLKRHLKDTKDTFFCPNGHAQSYTTSTETLLRKKLESSEERVNSLRQTIGTKNEEIGLLERQKSGIKGHLTKIRKRIANGVCPCCNRTFADLSDHMTKKHPYFKQISG